MATEHLLLFNQSFEVERSKLSIRIENFDIEYRPITVELESQTVDSELLGRIDVTIDAIEPEIERFDVDLIAQEPEVIRLEKEITAVEPEVIRFDQNVVAEEPVIEHNDIEITAQEPIIERNDVDITAEEPEIVKSDIALLAVEEPVETAEKDVSAIEPEIQRSDMGLVASEPVIETSDIGLVAAEAAVETTEVGLIAVDPVTETSDVGLVASEPVIVTLEKSILVEEIKPVNIDMGVHAVQPTVQTSDVGLVPIVFESTNQEKGTITDENAKPKADAFTEITDEFQLNETQEDNPLLEDIPDDVSELDGTLSSMSSTEFQINDEGFSTLSGDDPKSMLVWNVSGLAHTKSKKAVWDPFVQLVRQHDPDIVILQDVKLCSSKILGVFPRLSMRSYGGHVTPSYVQEVQDADLVIELQKTVFKKYYCVHSLSAWRVAGQLIFIKKEFEYLKIRYNLNIKTNAKYHHPEGRCIILQFKSFYLISLLSPLQGWVNRSVILRNRWDRDLAIFLNNSKSEKATIITGNLNCAPEDIDLSDPVKLKMEKSIVLHKQEEVGFPGSRDIDREGYHWITSAGNLTDVFRHKHPYDGTERRKKNIKFTTLAFLSDKTRCAVRTNLVLMSRKFLRNVKLCEIIGKAEDLDPSGWRHLPQLLKLEKKH